MWTNLFLFFFFHCNCEGFASILLVCDSKFTRPVCFNGSQYCKNVDDATLTILMSYGVLCGAVLKGSHHFYALHEDIISLSIKSRKSAAIEKMRWPFTSSWLYFFLGTVKVNFWGIEFPFSNLYSRLKSRSEGGA